LVHLIEIISTNSLSVVGIDSNTYKEPYPKDSASSLPFSSSYGSSSDEPSIAEERLENGEDLVEDNFDDEVKENPEDDFEETGEENEDYYEDEEMEVEQ